MNPAQPALSDQITTQTHRMVDLLAPLPDESFFAPKNGKWSAAETLQHLFLSARTLPRMLTGPHSLFEQWPRARRPARPYDEVAAAYEHTLRAMGVKAPASLVARPEDMQVGKDELLARFVSTHKALTESLTGWSEEELNTYQLPHPALGLITVGEMLHFTAYHIDHHRAIEADLLN